jgi:wyosine [tRNA(Phe)-imidazoG37] synthetase (radical SAM superfamily)
MSIENMPSFDHIMEFAHHIEKASSYQISDFQKASRVVLLKRE